MDGAEETREKGWDCRVGGGVGWRKKGVGGKRERGEERRREGKGEERRG